MKITSIESPALLHHQQKGLAWNDSQSQPLPTRQTKGFGEGMFFSIKDRKAKVSC